MEAQRQRRADLAARINAWRKERLQIAGEWVFRNLWRALKWIVRFLISFGWLLFELFLPVVLGVAALVEVITSTGSALPVVMIGTIVLIHFWLIIGVFFAKHLTSVQNVGLGNPGNSEQTGDEQISAGSDAESVQRNWRDLFCRILSDVGRWIGQHLSLLYRLVRPFRVTGAFVWRWFAADYAILSNLIFVFGVYALYKINPDYETSNPFIYGCRDLIHWAIFDAQQDLIVGFSVVRDAAQDIYDIISAILDGEDFELPDSELQKN